MKATTDISDATSAAGFGPALFIGLCIFTLATQSPQPPEYVNPAETMDMETVARVAMPEAVDIPDPDLPSGSRVDLALGTVPPAVVAAAVLPDTALAAPALPVRAALPLFDPPAPSGDIRPGTRPARPAPDAPGRAAPALPRLAMAVALTDMTPTPGTISARPVLTLTLDAMPGSGATVERAVLPGRFGGMALTRAPGLHHTAVDAPPLPQPAPVWRGVIGTNVRLREGPGLNAPVIDLFSWGTRALVLDRVDGWARVNLLNTGPPLTGWMSEAYLDPLE